MSQMKKLLSLLLAVVMLLAMATAAFAATVDGTAMITVPDTDSHTYAIYQIFTGELMTGETGVKTLSNIKWGQNGTGTAGEVVPEATLNNIKAITGTEMEKAAALSGYANLGSAPVGTVSKDAPATVKTGYYLIKDNGTIGQGDEETLYIVQVVGPTTIARKAGTTDSDKKLDDKNDSDATAIADNGTMQTSSDYDIGDPVPYHLTATISSKVGQYKTYHITLEDILEAGRFDAIDLDKNAITLGGDAIADTDDYTVTTTWNTEPTKAGFKVTYEFTPKQGKTLESLAGQQIAINFTATLGSGAAIGSAGNRNTLKVSYSNNPNETDGHSEGTTPDKVVITFTYKVVVNKFDENGTTPLAGAGFTLYKVSKSDAQAAASVTGDVAAKNTTWANKALHTWNATAAVGDTAEVANRFTFEGIDDGYYVLCETTTPAGYNTMDPQVFQVTATHDGLTLTDLTGEKVSGTIEFAPNTANDSLSANITNKKGSTLPETGGMGTTLLYVGGGVLVAAAVVLLILKKRMSVEK